MSCCHSSFELLLLLSTWPSACYQRVDVLSQLLDIYSAFELLLGTWPCACYQRVDVLSQLLDSYLHVGFRNYQLSPTRRARTFFLFSFSFISLIADGPHHYHPACGHKGSSHLSPVHPLQFFYRDASSALLQLVNQWLNFTYSRSHAFRYERKNTNPTLVRIELTTSVLADVQLTY